MFLMFFFLARIAQEVMGIIMVQLQQSGIPTSATNAAAAVPPGEGPGGVSSPPPVASYVRRCLKCNEMSYFREQCCLNSNCEA